MKSTFFVMGIFLLVVLIIIFPLLPPGYILTLDQLSSHKLSVPVITEPSFLYNSVLYLLGLVLPNDIVQKILLTSVLFVAFWGMYKFVETKSIPARFFAAFLFTVNPFTYARLVTGQWSLVLGYGLLPWCFYSMRRIYYSSSWEHAVILAVTFTLLASVSLHFLTIAFVFAGLYVVVLSLSADGSKKKFQLFLTQFGVSLIIFLILNLNWIYPVVIGQSSVNVVLSTIQREDLVIFQSVADTRFGLLVNLLSGYGFWAESYDYFLSPKTFFPLWPLVTFVILGLSLFGFYINFKRKNTAISISLAVFSLLAIDLAIGVASPQFARFVVDLYEKIPLLKGFREPQKLIAVVFLSYAYFTSISVEWLDYYMSKRKRIVLYMFLSVMLVLNTIPVFYGFWGQIKPVYYPASWIRVNTLLKQDKADFLTVFFPWHQYMSFKFANNRVINNPAPYYFDKPVISSQNFETTYMQSQDTSFESLHVDGLLSIEQEGVNLLGEEVDRKPDWANDLAAVSVKYVILAKDSDWRQYRFLLNTQDLRIVFEDESMVLLQNDAWGKEQPASLEPFETSF